MTEPGGRFSEWFEKRRESRIVGLSDAHVTMATSCVHKMQEAFQNFVNGDIEKGQASIRSLEKAEHDADQIKRQITRELSKGTLSPSSREDLLNLVKGVDDIADNSHDCGWLMSTFDMTPIRPEIKKILAEMTNNVKDGADQLKLAISALISSPSDSLVHADNVDAAEEAVDTAYYRGLLELSRMNDTWEKPNQTVLYASLLETLEHTADSCQDVADLVRLVVIRRS